MRDLGLAPIAARRSRSNRREAFAKVGITVNPLCELMVGGARIHVGTVCLGKLHAAVSAYFETFHVGGFC